MSSVQMSCSLERSPMCTRILSSLGEWAGSLNDSRSSPRWNQKLQSVSCLGMPVIIPPVHTACIIHSPRRSLRLTTSNGLNFVRTLIWVLILRRIVLPDTLFVDGICKEFLHYNNNEQDPIGTVPLLPATVSKAGQKSTKSTVGNTSTLQTVAPTVTPVPLSINPTRISTSCSQRALFLSNPIDDKDNTIANENNDVTTNQRWHQRRRKCEWRKPWRTVTSDHGEPKQYRNAVADGPKKTLWAKAIKQEINNFLKREVWKKFPRNRLQGMKPLKSRWVFKKKVEQDKSIRYKARVVVKGYYQIPGVRLYWILLSCGHRYDYKTNLCIRPTEELGMRDCRRRSCLSKCRPWRRFVYRLPRRSGWLRFWNQRDSRTILHPLG